MREGRSGKGRGGAVGGRGNLMEWRLAQGKGGEGLEGQECGHVVPIERSLQSRLSAEMKSGEPQVWAYLEGLLALGRRN